MEGDDQRDVRAYWRAKGGAVENVGPAREKRQDAEVPADIAKRYGCPTPDCEGMALERQFRRALELAK